jgi:signal transduction histidine kinase
MTNAKAQLRRVERILEISRELTTTVSLDLLLGKIVRAALELTESEAASILLLDKHSGELRFKTATCFADQLAEIPVPVERSIAGTAFSTGEPIITHDPHSDPRFYPLVEQLVGLEARSLLAVPLQFQDQPIGSLEVQNKRDSAGQFDQDDVETLTVLAAQAAVAIENARLVEDLREARDLAQALADAGAALSSTLNYEKVLDRILEQMARVVSFDAANVMLLEDDEVLILRGRKDELLGPLHSRPGARLKLADVAALRLMRETGQPHAIPDVEQDEMWHSPRSDPAWIRSYLGIPIRVQEQVIGFLNIGSATPGLFGQKDAARLQAFADQAAIGIENARLYNEAQQSLAKRIRAELELRLHRDQLEDLVQQRTVELEARNQELDAFAHTVAHDLRNPLSLVLGFAELLEQDCGIASREELQYYAQSVVRNGRKMSNIVDELLLLAGVRKIEVTSSPLNMAPIVAEAQRRLTHLIQEHEAEITVPDTWPVAMGYGPWIEEVWANYLSNAIMYGGSPPRIELGADVQADRMVRFWVRDHGPGISADQQQRLFIPFAQLAQGSAKGHGLGLSIVRRIMTKLGGQVGVESNGVPGQGSLFFFTLPGVK